MARHNKKRNTGLVYEFLARFVANSIVENDESKRNEAFKIIQEHFKKGTELYREFRLFNALISTTVSSESVAASIIKEAKTAARSYNSTQLDREKSSLIKSINHRINEGKFYNQPVSEYVQYATIQQLLDEWRKNRDGDIIKIAEFEDRLKEWLVLDKTKPTLQEHTSDDSSALVLKIMTKKFNEKYKDVTVEERDLIKSYVFQEHKKELVPRLKVIKDQTVAGIDTYLKEQGGKDKVLTEKLTKVRKAIVTESIDEVNDTTMEHFLDIAKLKGELECQN
jgi:hypothetical protein